MIDNIYNNIISNTFWRVCVIDRQMRSHWHALDNFRALSPSESRLRLAERLMAQVRYFGERGDALPEWREAARITDPEKFWEIWPSLPIITKKDLRNRFQPAEMERRFGLRGSISSTGGSTGEPTQFFHDEPMIRATDANRLYCRLQVGWEPGMPLIAVWGSERDIGKRGRGLKARFGMRLLNDWMVDGYRLSADTTDRVLELIGRFRFAAIYGFTGLLEFVARQVLEQGAMPPAGRVRAAWNGGEMLFDHQVELFRKAFGVPLLNFYGGRELSAMAFQPHEGASLRVLRPYLFVEIVDDRGKHVPPGETGRLIWTSTVCRGTPFLRYDIGDVGSSEAPDQDESGIHALTRLEGRHSGLMRLPNGGTIGCIFWNHLLKDYPEVEQFQVALIGDRRVELRLRGSGLDQERESRLRDVVRRFLGEGDVRISWVDRIPLTPQGKLVQVVRE